MNSSKKLNTKFLITDDQSHTLYSEQFGATYHSIRGAKSESKHVFIKNGLDYIVEHQKLKLINILEIGFGTGLNTWLTYQYSKNEKLNINYHTVEAFPISVLQAAELNYTKDSLLTDARVFEKIHQLEWDKQHKITDYFSFTKHLKLFEVFNSDQTFNLIYFDAFSPSEQPELWTVEIFSKLYNLLESNGVLVTYSSQGQMKRNMKQVGFKLQPLKGALGKREMTRGIK